jgi:hypothetical protein
MPNETDLALQADPPGQRPPPDDQNAEPAWVGEEAGARNLCMAANRKVGVASTVCWDAFAAWSVDTGSGRSPLSKTATAVR